MEKESECEKGGNEREKERARASNKSERGRQKKI